MARSLTWSADEVGAAEMRAVLDELEILSFDMREPLERSKDYIQELMREQFDSEGAYRGDDDGHPAWVDLEENYEKWKNRLFPGRPMLVLHDEMRQVVLSDASWVVTDREAQFDPPSEKAGWHQSGLLFRASGGRAHDKPNPLPSRPMLVLDEFDYQELEGIFEDWLGGLIGR